VKAVIKAGALARALSLAASLVETKCRIPALWHAHLVAAGDNLTITANALDFALKLCVPATVEASGETAETAVPSARLAALASGFPADAEITIGAEDKTTAVIACGRSRFKLPTLPLGDLPLMPAIDNETGRAGLDRPALLTPLSKPSFAISSEQTRFYLNGILLHDTKAGLAFVATDGHRLARAVLPGVTGLSQDRSLIVPKPAIKILVKLLADKAIDGVTLRRSATLIEVAAAPFTFVSKLIDADYPSYERVVPAPSKNSVIVDRVGLALALERIEAVTPEAKTAPTVGLVWKAGDPALRVVVPGWPDLADDLIAAEVSGTGRIAFQIRHGLELLDALGGDRVRVDSSAVARSPILITDPDDSDFTVVQMPCVWGTEVSSQAA
jgi:DNA polymerase-3 subunit beta